MQVRDLDVATTSIPIDQLPFSDVRPGFTIVGLNVGMSKRTGL